MAVAEVSTSTRSRHFEAAVDKLRAGVQAMAAGVREADGETLGEALIQIREAGIDPLEAVFADGVRRFDKSGEYQHVAVLARAAEHVGVAAVRKEEANLLQAAQTMDPGKFTGVAKNFEHRVDAAGALAEANHAYQRRYLHVGEPVDGLVRLDGLLDAEGGATLRTALQAFMKPVKDDARTYGQRQHDALMELCRQASGSKRDG